MAGTRRTALTRPVGTGAARARRRDRRLWPSRPGQSSARCCSRPGVRAPCGHWSRPRSCSVPTTAGTASSHGTRCSPRSSAGTRMPGWAAAAWSWSRWSRRSSSRRSRDRRRSRASGCWYTASVTGRPDPAESAGCGCNPIRSPFATSRPGSGCGCTSTRPGRERSSPPPGRRHPWNDSPPAPTTSIPRSAAFPGSACGPVPRCGSAAWVTRTPCPSVTTTWRGTSAGRWPARSSTTTGSRSSSSPGGRSAAGCLLWWRWPGSAIHVVDLGWLRDRTYLRKVSPSVISVTPRIR